MDEPDAAGWLHPTPKPRLINKTAQIKLHNPTTGCRNEIQPFGFVDILTQKVGCPNKSIPQKSTRVRADFRLMSPLLMLEVSWCRKIRVPLWV